MHGGSANHGCEAIIRTTSSLLGGPQNCILWSFAKEEDFLYGSSNCFEKVIASEEIEKFSISNLEVLIKERLLKQDSARLDVFLKTLFKNNLAFSVGGDNYCYPWSASLSVKFDKIIKNYCKKLILWGCSIENDELSQNLLEDLASYDLITAREQITYDYLRTINKNTVKVADSAFLLDKAEKELPQNFITNNTVGINISPLILTYADDELIVNNYRNLIKYIISETDMNVCLIPHVVWENNNDFTVINKLYDEFSDSNRICKVEDGNALEIKGYISKCRFFIGARTHATIAAYSTEVPTLVVGYSVKAIGIARDLFDTDENYVLPVQNLTNEDELCNHFEWLLQNEEKIILRLKNVLPKYIQQALDSKKLIENMKN